MTQNAPTERARTALKASAIDQSPLLSLEREDALFVLTDETLVYQDGGGTRRVTLRDLTRIHSDQAGLLRVETPAGTALTASLLGFDVGQVQSFFKEVRGATARSKDQPSSPLPTVGGAKTFGSAPTPHADTSASSANSFTDTAHPGSTAQTDDTSPASEDTEGTGTHSAGSRAEKTVSIMSTTPPERTASSTDSDLPEASTTEPERGSSGVGALAGKAVAAASGLFRGNAAQNESPPAESDANDTGKSGKPDLREKKPRVPVNSRTALFNRLTPRTIVKIPSEDTEDAPQPQPMGDRSAANVRGEAAEPADGESAPSVTAPPVTAPPVTALSRAAASTALARQAGAVGDLAGRLKLLAVVLFVGALLLALFQFMGGQPLAGIWTLLSGGVGAIALLALGEMSALLALIARVPGPARSPATESGHDSHDD
ncbi:hypothetical protein [Deinococcus arenicola]|uniref:YokE-like PH domain-containing protein n=1 Tax=Deinococcus arenicola TaxID=2994950 RepID=A0ABU4DT92_9DEIO|nr:hypothetical protein [Deinococcus sp. ZS9-10]MDV6375647.1 hypothetical protein [Deinococcus sp. ZS9-10]